MMQAAVLPGTTKVLMWDSGTGAAVLNWATGAITSVPTGTQLWCAGQVILKNGKVLAIGGDVLNKTLQGVVDTNLFDPATNTWTRLQDMHLPRFYPTATKLPDGRILAMGGSYGGIKTLNQRTQEIFDPNTGQWTLTAQTPDIPYYPHDFILPDGRMVITGATEVPVVTRVWNPASDTWSTVDASHVYDAGSSTMYRPGKILKAGSASDGGAPAIPSLNTAYVLDMTSGSPAWRQVGSMAQPRSFLNLTTLPDGNVLATGGDTNRSGTNFATGARTAELWSPATEQWTTLASEAQGRLYHSVGFLLPDGRVMVGGTGRVNATPNAFNYEIFSPPYLFKGPRPTIASAPSSVGYGQTFNVATPSSGSITSVVLIAPAAVTHAFDQNARYVPVNFTATNGNLSVTAPANGNLAPPGPYMLFVVNSAGVPSVASWVNVG